MVEADSVLGESATARLARRAITQLRRGASRLRTAEQSIAIAGDRALRRRDAPIGFAAVAPVVSQSRLASGLAHAWRRSMTAVIDSATAALIRRAAAASRRVPLEETIRRAAAMIAVAAVTHLLLLGLAQPYQYPSRAALFLPLIIAILASVVAAVSQTVARALTDRRSRYRL
jgi:hypothetical protein